MFKDKRGKNVSGRQTGNPIHFNCRPPADCGNCADGRPMANTTGAIDMADAPYEIIELPDNEIGMQRVGGKPFVTMQKNHENKRLLKSFVDKWNHEDSNAKQD
jgi:hypothetical protein